MESSSGDGRGRGQSPRAEDVDVLVHKTAGSSIAFVQSSTSERLRAEIYGSVVPQQIPETCERARSDGQTERSALKSKGFLGGSQGRDDLGPSALRGSQTPQEQWGPSLYRSPALREEARLVSE